MRRLVVETHENRGGNFCTHRVIDSDHLDTATQGPQGEDLTPMVEAEQRKAAADAAMAEYDALVERLRQRSREEMARLNGENIQETREHPERACRIMFGPQGEVIEVSHG
jgi:uncharacterized protein YdaT